MNLDAWPVFTGNFGEIHEPYTAFVTLVDLVLYFFLSLNVGRGRRRYKVEAPSTDGPPEFLRIFRVQQNTLEQLVMHLPLLWLAALAMGDVFAAAFGCIWPLGRILYARGYYRDAKRRHKGFLISMAVNAVLLLGALTGIVAAF